MTYIVQLYYLLLELMSYLLTFLFNKFRYSFCSLPVNDWGLKKVSGKCLKCVGKAYIVCWFLDIFHSSSSSNCTAIFSDIRRKYIFHIIHLAKNVFHNGTWRRGSNHQILQKGWQKQKSFQKLNTNKQIAMEKLFL